MLYLRELYGTGKTGQFAEREAVAESDVPHTQPPADGLSFYHEIEHFARAVAGQVKADVDAQDAYHFMQILDALYDSAQCREKVLIDLKKTAARASIAEAMLRKFTDAKPLSGHPKLVGATALAIINALEFHSFDPTLFSSSEKQGVSLNSIGSTHRKSSKHFFLIESS